MTMRKTLLVAVTAVAAIATSPAYAADMITYTGSDTQGDVRIDYSITTDGTTGPLSLLNIVSSAFTFTGLSTEPGNSHNFAAFTDYNTLYFTDLDDNSEERMPGSVSASATDLFFDFGGSGDLNAGGPEGLVYAFAAKNTNEYGSVVYHDDGNGGRTLPTKELEDFNRSQSYRLEPGTYTQVAAINQSFATAVAGAVPEPASWAMMIFGMGAIGSSLRRRQKMTTRVAFA